jgi:hypothetical protein
MMVSLQPYPSTGDLPIQSWPSNEDFLIYSLHLILSSKTSIHFLSSEKVEFWSFQCLLTIQSIYLSQLSYQVVLFFFFYDFPIKLFFSSSFFLGLSYQVVQVHHSKRLHLTAATENQ